jgi:hypothetical protein
MDAKNTLHGAIRSQCFFIRVPPIAFNHPKSDIATDAGVASRVLLRGEKT